MQLDIAGALPGQLLVLLGLGAGAAPELVEPQVGDRALDAAIWTCFAKVESTY